MSSSSLTFCPGLFVIVLALWFNLVATVRWAVLDFFNLSSISVIVEDFCLVLCLLSLIRIIVPRCKQRKNPKSPQLSVPPTNKTTEKHKKTLHLVLEPQRGRLMLPSLTVSPSLVFKKMTQKTLGIYLFPH